ncbi:MAG: extracellular solute-binding protein [Pseudorhodoplanes sp.]
MKSTRRSFLRHGAVALAAPALGALPSMRAAFAQGAPAWRHALSLFGEVKYPADFPHFEYVDPKAPKGGVVRLGTLGSFDNFNQVTTGVKGQIAAGIELIYDSLMVPAYDEISTEYGLLAEAVSYPDDFSSVTYRLRANAKWHDGQPVTPDDVIFSLETFKKNSPFYSAYYRHVTKAEKTGERDITFTFDGPGNRELPQIIGQLNILPKHWWEGADKEGRKRDVGATTLEIPLGCGAYRLKEFVSGRTLVYERVPDYWGANLPVNVGRDNFNELRIEYYRDSTVAIEAFKADAIDWRTENSAKDWATAYDFPAVRDKRVVLEEFPMRNIGRMQGFGFNIRREKFADPRLRRAFNYVYDFEEMNKQLFYGKYERVDSYFYPTELASSGLPQGLELDILKTVQGKVPPEVFTTAYANPVNGSPDAVRTNLREALRLLKEAGYEIRDRKLTNVKTGEPFTVELLSEQPAFERIMLFYKPALERLGVTVTVRTIDSAQYERRQQQWDYDMIMVGWGQSLSPGNEQRDFWGSQAADRSGSRNLVGIKNEAVDALIERIIFAKDRADLVAATKALDRVLLWNFYVVPGYTYTKTRVARWDRFGAPANLPKYNSPAFPTIWWWDKDKAAKAGSR